MSNFLVLFVSLIYLIVGIGYCINSQMGLGITFIFYAGANIGLYMTAIGY